MTARIQLRGNCQLCGRDQAVNSNRMAQHGYTVDHGYFNGVCHGHKHAPLQVERSFADKVIADVAADAVRMAARIGELQAGSVFPATITLHTYKYVNRKMVYDTIPFEQGDEYQKERAVSNAVHQLESRIRSAESFCRDLKALADRVHGTPLIEVVITEGPARVQQGDKKLSGLVGRVLTAKHQDGGRVTYSYVNSEGKTFTAWIGVAAWRKLPAVTL